MGYEVQENIVGVGPPGASLRVIIERFLLGPEIRAGAAPETSALAAACRAANLSCMLAVRCAPYCRQAAARKFAGGCVNRKKTNTIAPVNRIPNCIGTLATALKIKLSRDCAIDLPVRYRWTWTGHIRNRRARGKSLRSVH